MGNEYSKEDFRTNIYVLSSAVSDAVKAFQQGTGRNPSEIHIENKAGGIFTMGLKFPADSAGSASNQAAAEPKQKLTPRGKFLASKPFQMRLGFAAIFCYTEDEIFGNILLKYDRETEKYHPNCEVIGSSESHFTIQTNILGGIPIEKAIGYNELLFNENFDFLAAKT